MRVGDKILVVTRPRGHDGTDHVVLQPARVTYYAYARGKRQLQFEGKAVRGASGGKMEGVSWCRGWDDQTDAAKALRVACTLAAR